MPADPSRAPPGLVVAAGPQPSGQSVRLLYETPEALIGHTLNDRYQIQKLLGSGGMGTVYLAEHVLIHKQVAVKVLSPSHARKPAEVERFLREARAASRIRHENVVDITDFGYTSSGLAFLVMEYLEGEDLSSTSHREGALHWRRAVHIIRQICAALEAAHAQGVIHRDMKPENVYRMRRGEEPDFIKVLDFGIAKIIDENYDPEQPSQTSSGLMGTPEYVAPELIRGLKPDVRVDIYAVGVILYRLLTGRVPFAGESFMATLTAHLMETPRDPREVAPAAEIPPAIAAVCLQSLAKDRDERFPTIREFALALRGAEVGPPLPVPLALESTRRGLLPILGGLVALILLAAAVLYAYRSGRESVPEVARVEVVPAPSDMPEGAGPKGQAEAPVAAVPAVVAPVAVVAPAAVVEPPVVEPPVEPVVEPTEERNEPHRSGGPRPSAAPLPDRLSSIELADGMRKLIDRVNRDCSRYAMRKMEVGLRVEVAASGKVQAATPTGLQSGALGDCVAKVARTARYKRAKQGAEFVYTFRM